MKQSCLPTAPRLSQLPGNQSLAQCANCGAARTGRNLEVWAEHNHFDQVEPRSVVLCLECAAKVVPPHPRLYRRLQTFEPFPGAMPLCDDCAFRDRLECKCPKAQFNGGTGLVYVYPEPARAISCRPGSGKGCKMTTIYYGPVEGCSGKQVKA